MRIRSQVFDGGGFIMVPTGSQRMHSITPEGVEALYRSPGPFACGRWALGSPPSTSRYCYTYERYSNFAKKMWQNYQFSRHHIIPPNRSTSKLRHKQMSVPVTTQWAAHWNTWPSRHALHCRHSRHILHWYRHKICCAIGTERPA